LSLPQPFPWPDGSVPAWRERPRLPPIPRAELLRSLLFFVLTAASVFATGGVQLLEDPAGQLAIGLNVATGLKLVTALLAILLSHEMGHYIACRYYGVDASLPYFIPFPLGLAGTLGAFIRIRAPIPDRRALFDIGIAGPLAGFVVCLPVMVLGALEGTWTPLVNGGEGPGYLGEPLLFGWVVELLRGPTPDGMTLAIGPLGMAAWFGLFVTSLNLMPVGQLDGGHVTYALWPRWARAISRIGILVCLALLYFRPSWLLWAILLLILGRNGHPPTLYDHEPVGRTRLWIGLLGFAILAVSFTPSPIMISWSEFLEAFGL
jgi:membrane-associated protease RseP (regulator of RpoE activity)